MEKSTVNTITNVIIIFLAGAGVGSLAHSIFKPNVSERKMIVGGGITALLALSIVDFVSWRNACAKAVAPNVAAKKIIEDVIENNEKEATDAVKTNS